MSRKDSGYQRKERDYYPTPAWVVTDALAKIVPLKGRTIWEPACGTGEMVDAIAAAGGMPHGTDIHDYGYAGMRHQHDFLQNAGCPGLVHYDGIITNPPYGERSKTAEGFIEFGLARISDYGFLALLLPVDFDSGGTRAKYFRDCPQFAGTIVLTKRIKWFEGEVQCKPCKGAGTIGEDKCKSCGGRGTKKTGPSENHAWFLWQQTWLSNREHPRKWYAP
jgi:hypothetical protein